MTRPLSLRDWPDAPQRPAAPSRFGLLNLSLVAAIGVAGCAGLPEPPAPTPSLESPPLTRVDFLETLPEVPAPRPLPPRLRWTPEQPGEGTVVAIILHPAPRGLPLFEARGRTGERELGLVPLRGGGFLALVPAPLSRCTTAATRSCPAQEIPVEIEALLSDGTRLREHLTLRVEPREFPATRLRVASRYTAPDPRTLERIQRERAVVRQTLQTVSEEPLWHGEFIRPLAGVTTSAYGQRRLFNNQLRSRHTGHDIDGDTGDPIYAANSGRVALSRDLFFNGNAVFIDHGLGLYTGYFHLSERLAEEGQWVQKGELIGRVGATGRVTGPHLHWSLYLNGSALDPLSLLEPGLALVSQRLLTAPPTSVATP